MSSAQNRLVKRRLALAQLKKLFDHPDNVYVIHYSCESFYDKEDGRSPRVTSIAVRNLQSAQTTSFSIHQMAERCRVLIESLDANYDDLEKQMLKEFFDFIERSGQSLWLHWNMRDINYGFQAIYHRFRVLGGKPVDIPVERLYDLARIMLGKYGSEYIDHPRMEQLARYNSLSLKDALKGAEEAKAFEEQQYVKLHQSTLRKVDVIANIAERSWNDTLKTKANWLEQHGSTLFGITDAMFDTALYKWGSLTVLIADLVALFFVVWRVLV